MGAFTKIAKEHGIAVLVIHHPNKKQDTNILLRAGGSIGLTAAARSVLVVTGEPYGQDRMLVPIKSNFARLEQTGLPFTISSARGSSRVSWGSREVEVDSDIYGPKTPTKLDEARKWLRERLK